MMTQTKIEGKFYPLTSEIGKKLREANLTAAQWKLWSYLVEIDSFGDRYHDLPDTLTIMQKVGIKKSTYYTAIAKFQELGLFDFQSKGFTVRNLQVSLKEQKQFPKFGNDSQNSETIPKIRKRFPKFGNNSKNSENETPEAFNEKASNSSQTLQTHTEFIQTLSDDEREVLIQEKKPDSLCELDDFSDSSKASTLEKNQNLVRGQISATSLNNSSNFANPNLQNLAPKEKDKFLAFAKKKASELPKLPTLLNRWIEKHFVELYEQFYVLEKQREAARVAREATLSKDNREINSSDRSQNNDKTDSFTPMSGEFLQQLKKEVMNNARPLPKSTSRMY